MKTRALACCAVVLSATTLLAADVAGTWNVDGDVQGHPVVFTTSWTQDGETLSGTATLPEKEVPVTGSVKEQAVTFEFDAESNGQSYHLVFTGTIGGEGGIKGTIAVSGAEGTFTATKQ